MVLLLVAGVVVTVGLLMTGVFCVVAAGVFVVWETVVEVASVFACGVLSGEGCVVCFWFVCVGADAGALFVCAGCVVVAGTELVWAGLADCVLDGVALVFAGVFSAGVVFAGVAEVCRDVDAVLPGARTVGATGAATVTVE